MKLVLSLIFIVLSLPPFNYGVFGLVIYLPLFFLFKNSNTKADLIYGMLYGCILSIYIYLGVFSYTPSIFFAIVIFFILLSSLFFYFLGLTLRIFPVAYVFLLGLICVLYEIILSLMSIPLSHSLVITSEPNLIQGLKIGGTYLLTWMLISFQACIFHIYIYFKERKSNKTNLAFVFSFLTLIISICVSTNYSDETINTEILNAAVVQTNTHPLTYINIAADGTLTNAYNNRIALNKKLSSYKNLDLAIWPESSSHGYEFRLKRHSLPNDGITHLINSPDLSHSGVRRNSMFSVLNNQILNTSSKNLLIPFLETAFKKSKNSSVHFNAPGNVGALVCFESGFATPAIKLIRENAGLISISTSDAYAGPSILPLFHNRFSIIRAVENQRYVLRSGNGGLSVIVDNKGNILDALPLFSNGVIFAQIKVNYENTFYSKNHYVWHYSFLFFACFTILLLLIKNKKNYQVKNPISRLTLISLCVLMIALVIGQILYVSHIFNKNSNINTVKQRLYSPTFENSFSSKNVKFDSLLVKSNENSLLSSIAYISRMYGNDLSYDDIKKILIELQNKSISAIETNKLVHHIGFEFQSIPIKKQNSLFPLIFLNTQGEHVVLTKLSGKNATVFSPRSGLLKLDKEYFFSNISSQNPIYISTTKRNWDLPDN